MLDKWLTSAGLEHLIPVFEAHGIGETELSELTDDDLRELGLKIGDRKRFRRALALRPAAIASGERRPMTLGFFDLIDSSALCERLDDEDMVEVLRIYRECCCSAIAKYGGHVAHLLGDGILAYFGYPSANENDCECAVQAALEISRDVPGLKSPADGALGVRCGIATGRVVVTELFAGAVGEAQSVTGTIANLAHRLQALAQPNGIVISDSTAASVRHLFRLEDMGPQHLKGYAEPRGAFTVTARRALPQLPEEDDTVLTAFVGREGPLAELDRAWRLALRDGARVAVVNGEPGIGKSRLIRHFLAKLPDNPARDIVRFYGSAFDEHVPLGPVTAYVRRKIGLPDGASGSEITEAVAGMFEGQSPTHVEALTSFLGRADPTDEGAQSRRQGALEALADYAFQEARKRPQILVAEDAHWLDATTRELIASVLSAKERVPILVVIGARTPGATLLPEVDPAVIVNVPLGPLGDEEVRRMVRSTFGDEPVPREVVAGIAGRADGVPLFIEELLRPLLRSSGSTNWAGMAADVGPSSVPETLQEALAARLDRLGRSKEVAQVAAVLGRSVELPILAHVLRQEPGRVAERLDALCSAGVLRRDPDHTERYVFAHALLCDAAYDSMLRDQRQRLHATVADVLREIAPDFCATRPDVVARHLTEGQRLAEALPYWLAAGRAATARSALHEAKHDLERGADIAEKLPQTPEIVETRLEFASLLGPVLFALCGPGSPESHKVYETAVTLAEAASESAPHFPLLWGWWKMSKDFRIKRERARMLLRLAERRGESEMLLQAHHCNWASAFHAGEFDRARRHIEEGIRLYDRGDTIHRPWLFGNHDAKVCGHGELAQVLWMQGHAKRALEEERRALVWAKRKRHAGTLAHAYDLALLHRYYCRDALAVRSFADRMIELAEDQGMPEHRARGHLFQGWALAQQGDTDAGLQVFEEGYRRQRSIGTDEDTPIYVCMHAEILNRLGLHERALHDLREVCAELERLEIRNWLSEVWRQIGETAMAADPAMREQARTAFERSARIATEQRVLMLELRTALSSAAISEDADLGRSVADLMEQRRRIDPGGDDDEGGGKM